MTSRQEIRETVSMLDAIDMLGMTRPRNDGKTWCPFHDENTPSFHVYGDHGYCYGCGWNGDVVWFVASVCGSSIPKAEQFLLGAGGSVSSTVPTCKASPQESATAPPIDFTDRFNAAPVAGPMVRSIAEELVQKYWPVLTLKKIENLGVKVCRDGLWLPHYDSGIMSGVKVIRYNHQRESLTGSKFRQPYMIYQILNGNPVVLCEGEPDTWAMWYALGHSAAVVGLPSGAGNITSEVIAYLSKFQNIYLAMDNDKAGFAASDKIVAELEPHLIHQVQTLNRQYPDHKDVADALYAGWKPEL